MRGIVLRLFVSARFQVLFTPLAGVLFTFPSRYWLRYRSQGVFSLTRWSGRIRTGLLLSRATRDAGGALRISHTGLSPSMARRSMRFCYTRGSRVPVPRPQSGTPDWFRLFPVRSPLLRESHSISFPPGTEMFQFPGFPPHRLWIQRWVTTLAGGRVPPFGHPRINACLRLLAAYRSLPRPSSAPCA